MDRRRWYRRKPWEKHLSCYVLFFLVLQRSGAGNGDFQQELKDKTQGSTKLDNFNKFVPYESREETDEKRSSSFFPLRGKKPADEDSFMASYDDAGDKRAQFFPLRGKKVPDDLKRASYFMPMRGKKDEEDDYDSMDDVSSKRASSFMPMRGKKKYATLSDYFNKAGTYANDVVDSSSNQNLVAGKRLQQFIPVRGRRSLKESTNIGFGDLSANASRETHANQSETEGSVASTPVRGRRDIGGAPGGIATTLIEKKSLEVPDQGYESSAEVDKKASGFVPMRGRKNNGEDSENVLEETKRAYAFVPMRGRRAQFRDVVYDIDRSSGIESKIMQEKRFHSFVPMRGKRSLDKSESIDSTNKAGDEEELEPWTASQLYSLLEKKYLNYEPMKGQKIDEETFTVAPWTPDQLMPLLDKKASAFMPMRGRKEDESFTVEPWTLDQLLSLLNKKSTFVPMRGRKNEDEGFTVAPWTPDQLMSLLQKKASSFMPMRGRKDDETFTVTPWTPDQLMSLLNKKAAFIPMRGRKDEEFTVAPWTPDQLMPLLDKKSTEESSENKQTETDGGKETEKDGMDKKGAFIPMRGRRMELDQSNLYDSYPYLMAGIGSSLMTKPYSDRGVKFTSVSSPQYRKDKLRINWDAVKRAFHASRGKRFQEINDSLNESYSSDTDGYKESLANDTEEKSRAKRAFIWKKVFPALRQKAPKRPMSFFATRGKRMFKRHIPIHLD